VSHAAVHVPPALPRDLVGGGGVPVGRSYGAVQAVGGRRLVRLSLTGPAVKVDGKPAGHVDSAAWLRQTFAGTFRPALGPVSLYRTAKAVVA
jgi:hypothetical protein